MISEKLKQVLLAQLELDDWEFTDETTADMIPGWDSLSHARIIAAVEDAYAVRFQIRDIMQLENIGQMQALLDRQQGHAP